MIRVLCVDDHHLVREGVAAIINRQTDMVLVASAATEAEALDLFHQYRPDITLMDLRLGANSGVAATRAIRTLKPDARIVMLTVHAGTEDIFLAFQAGAASYVLKSALSDDLIRVIREVNEGHRPLAPEIRERLAARAAAPSLTKREVDVMQLLSHGLRNKEIAASLGISEETAREHVKNILAKLDVTDRVAAVRVALLRGIIHLA